MLLVAAEAAQAAEAALLLVGLAAALAAEVAEAVFFQVLADLLVQLALVGQT